MRVAAIDCGTNSIRLLVADIDEATNTLTDLVREMQVVRLGQGVDRSGELNPEALQRTFTAIDGYAKTIAELGVERLRFVATSATRDAHNRDVFVRGVQERLGVSPQVVSGQEEATLSFVGATKVFGGSHQGPFLVVDLGGGSTEVVLGGDQVIAGVSMDVGCVRMAERHLLSDPPTVAQLQAAQVDIRKALDLAGQSVDFGACKTLVGLAGSVTTVTAHALGLQKYEPERINGAVLPVDAILNACLDLVHRDKDSRSALGFMHPGRVDVIAAGAWVWAEVVTYVREKVALAGGSLESVLTSEHDILDGIAWSLL